MKYYGYVGNKILELIVKKKITQNDFAKAMQVYPSTVSQWISGTREPRLATIYKICELYDVSADWLLGIDN